MKGRNLIAGLAALVLLALPGKGLVNATLPSPLNQEYIETILDELPSTQTKHPPTEAEVIRLAQMIYWEGAGSDDVEKIAIGYSALNRLADNKKRFGKDLNHVINHPAYSYFSPTKVKKSLRNPENMCAFNECYDIAGDILTGKYPDPAGATHYYNPKKANPSWKDSPMMENIGKILVSNGEESDHSFASEI